jgi:ligand-binding sensor domain-containing protein/serine phosphatase RsbU (regulator of sigma subunit)
MRGTVQRVAWGGAAMIALTLTTRDARALDPSKTPAQYVTHEWRQSDDGLPANYVPALLQTRDGYLWLASQEGLVRFDGDRFVVYSTRNVPALGTNDIDALAEDTSGALWIGTRGAGIVRYANGAYTSLSQKDGLAHDVVLALAGARDGSLWVGTRGGGVSHLQDGKFTTYRMQDGLVSDTVRAVAELPDGALAFGTDEGLSVLRGGHVTSVAGLSGSSVFALHADADGTLWIGSSGGIDRWQNGTLTSLREADGIGPGGVHALLRDRDGNLWLGAQSGIRRLATTRGAPGVQTPLGALSSLDGDGVHRYEAYALAEDREGNVWAGLSSEGLLRLRDGKVTTFGSRFVWTTYEDTSGMWFGTENGIFTLRGDELVPLAPSMPDIEISAVIPGRDTTWIGTVAHGLYRLDGARFTKWDRDPAIANTTVATELEDANGALWIGTHYGLERFDGTTLTRFHTADGVPEVEILAMVSAPDGSIWFGGRAGLIHYKDGAFTRTTTKDGLSADHIQTLLLDGDDLWIGTSEGGLNLLRAGKFGHVTTKTGLFNDIVYAIVDDTHGNLWMTCNRGIFHAPKSELADVAMGTRARVESVVLTTSDGMKSSECNGGHPGGIRAKDGRLWFASTEGAVRVDPAHMPTNTIVPPVHIEDVEVDRAPIDLTSPRHNLAAGSRDFQFEYTALSFTAPERVRFKYQLEGFDKTWIDAGARRIAYYTNLSPGSYRFRVKAANDDGVWNEEGADVSFVLAPRFYQTIPFYLLCAFGLMFIGAGSVRARLLALRARAEELERKVDERTGELAKANTDLAGAFKSLAEKDARLHEDLLEAQAFQQRILPKLPSGGAVRFRALYRPADLVGGDIYDICELGDRHYRVFIADTTGHGIQASLRTMVLKTEYDRVKLAPEGPARVLSELNQKITSVYPDLELRCSACCFDVIADGEGAARIVYANAAHPPLLRIARGKVDEIYARGTFLGVMDDAPFTDVEAQLGAGERLLAYTDGLYEQEDANGRPFGMERMIALLADYALDAEGIVQVLDTEVTSFSAGRALADDMLLVCIECAGDRRSKVDL